MKEERRNIFFKLTDERVSKIKENHKKIHDICRDAFPELMSATPNTEKYLNLYDQIILPKIICENIKVIFERLNIDLDKFDFSLVTFESNVDLSKMIFYKDLIFEGTQFRGKVNFYNTTFKKNVNFYYTRFFEDAHFSETTFNNTADFSVACFEKRAMFENFEAEKGDLIFYYPFFKSGFYFSPEKEVKYLELDSLRKNENDFFKTTEEKYDKIKNASRQTWRLLKHIAIENHNKILANKLLRKEMSAYWKELKWYDIGDRIILFFNKWSNNYGLSWVRGIIFTLVTAFICFSLYWISLKDFTLTFWVEYFKSLNPVYKLAIGINNVPTVIFYLLEKIFLVLGIFRINQAFRKLNDKW
ncbi:MAG: pentapeptide repeat-containing protein [Fusobacteriaceae bacterium]